MANEGQSDPLRLAAEKAFVSPFGAILELRPDDGASLWIDGRGESPVILDVPPAGKESACIWRGARETLQRALANARAFDSAYLSGRLTIAGDMSVMARLETQDGR